MFIGFNPNHKGYKCFDPVSKCVYRSHQVIFDKTLFPTQQSSLNSMSPQNNMPNVSPVVIQLPDISSSLTVPPTPPTSTPPTLNHVTPTPYMSSPTLFLYCPQYTYYSYFSQQFLDHITDIT